MCLLPNILKTAQRPEVDVLLLGRSSAPAPTDDVADSSISSTPHIARPTPLIGRWADYGWEDAMESAADRPAVATTPKERPNEEQGVPECRDAVIMEAETTSNSGGPSDLLIPCARTSSSSAHSSEKELALSRTSSTNDTTTTSTTATKAAASPAAAHNPYLWPTCHQQHLQQQPEHSAGDEEAALWDHAPAPYPHAPNPDPYYYVYAPPHGAVPPYMPATHSYFGTCAPSQVSGGTSPFRGPPSRFPVPPPPNVAVAQMLHDQGNSPAVFNTVMARWEARARAAEAAHPDVIPCPSLQGCGRSFFEWVALTNMWWEANYSPLHTAALIRVRPTPAARAAVPNSGKGANRPKRHVPASKEQQPRARPARDVA